MKIKIYSIQLGEKVKQVFLVIFTFELNYAADDWQKANLNKNDNAPHTALAYASLNGHFEIVKLFVEKKVLFIESFQDIAKQALANALSIGHLEIIKLQQL